MPQSAKQLNSRLKAVTKALRALEQGSQSRARTAEILGVCAKTVDRLRRSPPKQASDLAHANSGRRPSNALPPEMEARVARILSEEPYAGLGPTMAQEALDELHGLRLSKETVRRLMSQAGLWKPGKSKAKRVHLLRPPRARLGELIQADGCLHEWIAGFKMCLMILVDDATSLVVGARFEPFESALGYARAFESMALARGLPRALYSDRHSIFAHTPKAGEPPSAAPTRFSAMLARTGVGLLLAGTPQAKGRVERMNRTLQGRLVPMLRMAGAKTIEDANRLLPAMVEKINARFGKAPRLPGSAFSAWEGPEPLAQACGLREARRLSSGLSFVKEGVLRQVGKEAAAEHGARRLAGQTVELCEGCDGSESILWRGRSLPFSTFEAKRAAVASDSKEVDPAFEALSLASEVAKRQAGKAAREAKSQARQKLRRALEAQGVPEREIVFRVDKIA